MSLCSASVAECSHASDTSSPILIEAASSLRMSFCSRDRSMICCTSRVRRSLSRCIRPEKRTTASGSSLASATASASRLSAPTGVLSSWLTLATKSRRIDSTRCSRVRSSASTRMRREVSGATRAWMNDVVPRLGCRYDVALADLAVAAHLAHQLHQLRRLEPVVVDQAHGDTPARRP